MLGDWTRRPRKRARDVDREYAAGLLRDATTQGQLTSEEFEARLAATLSARHLGDLAIQVEDLQNGPLDLEPMSADWVGVEQLPSSSQSALPADELQEQRRRIAERNRAATAFSIGFVVVAVVLFVMAIYGH